MAQDRPRNAVPRRVNIIFRGKVDWALVKPERGDCPAAATGVALLQARPGWRTCAWNKWLLRVPKQGWDEQGRPRTCILRNDRHPQRSLRADEPVCIDNSQWTAKHTWVLEYDDGAQSPDSVMAPFRIRSQWDSRYLVVDEDSRQLALQSEQPEFCWEFQRAAGRSGRQGPGEDPALRASLAEGPAPLLRLSDFLEPAGPDAPPAPAASEDRASGSATSGSEGASPQKDPAPRTPDVFCGSLEEAFRSHAHFAGGQVPFAAPSDFSVKELCLGDEVQVALPPLTLETVFQALLGPASDFRARLADGEEPVVGPLERVGDLPGVLVGRTVQTLRIPVRGRRPFVEDVRAALCGASASAPRELGVQLRGTLSLGWPVGDFTTQSLHLFQQAAPGCPVMLRSLGLVQTPMAQQQAAEGLRDSRRRFVAAVSEFLAPAKAPQPPPPLPPAAGASGDPVLGQASCSFSSAAGSTCGEASHADASSGDAPSDGPPDCGARDALGGAFAAATQDHAELAPGCDAHGASWATCGASPARVRTGSYVASPAVAVGERLLGSYSARCFAALAIISTACAAGSTACAAGLGKLWS